MKNRVEPPAELALQFSVKLRELSRRVGELRDAPAGPPLEDVSTLEGAGHELPRERVLNERPLDERPVARPRTSRVT
jgi:hypothetical protein